MALELVNNYDYDSSSNIFVVDNAFSADYDNYLVSMRFLTVNGNRNPGLLLLDSSGTTVTTNNYYAHQVQYSFTGFGYAGALNTSAINYYPSYYINNGNAWASAFVYFHQPYSSGYTSITTYGGGDMVYSSNLTGTMGFGYCARNEIHRGFQISQASTFTGGRISVYGLK